MAEVFAYLPRQSQNPRLEPNPKRGAQEPRKAQPRTHGEEPPGGALARLWGRGSLPLRARQQAPEGGGSLNLVFWWNMLYAYFILLDGTPEKGFLFCLRV